MSVIDAEYRFMNWEPVTEHIDGQVIDLRGVLEARTVVINVQRVADKLLALEKWLDDGRQE
jgi:hypothetical protein